MCWSPIEFVDIYRSVIWLEQGMIRSYMPHSLLPCYLNAYMQVRLNLFFIASHVPFFVRMETEI